MMDIYETMANELNQCREDERSGQNQIHLTISAGGTLLTCILGASYFTNIDNETMLFGLFVLSDIILCVTALYIAAIGINSVLRYHYMQYLEDEISNYVKNGKNNFLHWVSFSAVINTRNIKHVTNSHFTVISYICYSGAAILGVLFCAAIIFFENYNLKNKFPFLWYIPIGVMICVIFIFVYVSINAKKMFKISMEIGLKKRNERLNSYKEIKKNIFRAIIYYFYPKNGDFQKVLFVITGFIIGLILKYNKINSLYSLLIDNYKNFILCFVIIEFLIYQARYQWNDVRGLKEDLSMGKNNRLPVNILGIKSSVKLSMIIIFIRLLFAVYLCRYLNKDTRIPIMIAGVMIILSAILYETVRELGRTKWIFFIVSLGYPIRFFAGLLTAYPEFFTDNLFGTNHYITYIVAVLLFLSYAALGEVSAVLPWVHETVIQKNNNVSFSKSYYVYLYTIIEDRYKSAFAKNNTNIFPLKEKGKISDIWNISYILSMSILSILIIILYFSKITIILELLLILAVFFTCLSDDTRIPKGTVFVMGISIIKIILNIYFIHNNRFYYIICIHHLVFTLVYYVLRCLFDPSYDFTELVVNIIKIIPRLLVGETTSQLIKDEKNNSTTIS